MNPENANIYAECVNKKRHPRTGTGIRSTNIYFLRRKPEKYRAVVEMLGEGISPSRIKKTLGVCQETVQAIWDREAETIAEHRQAYLRKARLLAQSLVDDIQARLPGMDVQELLLSLSALTNHICELEDELPVIESRRADNPTFGELLESLPRSEAQAPERADDSELSQF